MKEFLIANWFVLLLAVVLLGFEIYLIVTKQWTKLREQAYALMLTAERVFSSEEGKKKFEAVFEALYFNLIPLWLRLFVTPESIREKLQEWYNLAKNYLDDGIINSRVMLGNLESGKYGIAIKNDDGTTTVLNQDGIKK